MKLATSNLDKIKEFKEILGNKIEIVKGEDIREVMGNYREVILYKAFAAGKGFVVEDTVLEVNGEQWVDIRYKLNELKDHIGESITWITSLGYNTGEAIYVYTGKINGIVGESKGTTGFAFDKEFIPRGETKTLSELNDVGRKSEFSARKIAIEKLNKKTPDYMQEIFDLTPWDGEYQGD